MEATLLSRWLPASNQMRTLCHVPLSGHLWSNGHGKVMYYVKIYNIIWWLPCNRILTENCCTTFTFHLSFGWVTFQLNIKVNRLNLDSFETDKYFGSGNVTSNYWRYQRASLDDQIRNIGQDTKLLVVHGMEDSIVDIKHSMKLARVWKLWITILSKEHSFSRTWQITI